MASFNQVILLGNLGKDPEVIKPTEKGLFVRLSIATTRRYTDPTGVLQEDTQWNTVYVSNAQGKATAEYLKKGSKVQIVGELRTNEWNDSKTGTRQFATAVYASKIIFLDAKAPEPTEEAVLPDEVVNMPTIA